MLHTSRAAAATPAASNAAAADAEPINPEDYARQQQAARGGRSAEEDEDMDTDAEGRQRKEYREEDEDPARTALKHRILDAALPHVAELGWSYECLRLGAASLGLSSASAGLVDRGAVELVERVQTKASERMRAKVASLPEEEFASLSTGAKLEIACRARLEGLLPYLSHWPQALALLSQPCHLAKTIRSSAQVVDEIWYLCGDRSTNSEWYSKRALLGAVYASTELFLLTDRTAKQEATWTFLRRQLVHARDASAIKDQAGQAAQVACNMAAAAFTRLVPQPRSQRQHQHHDQQHQQHDQAHAQQQQQQQQPQQQQPQQFDEPVAQQGQAR
jgi:ubiquinone biosynthesis protein COQ9